MDPIIVSALTVLTTVVSTTLVVSNYLNRRFSKQELAEVKITAELENLLYRINANHELIEHRTKRFLEIVEHNEKLAAERFERSSVSCGAISGEFKSEINQLTRRTSQIENYLIKSGYVVRD